MEINLLSFHYERLGTSLLKCYLGKRVNSQRNMRFLNYFSSFGIKYMEMAKVFGGFHHFVCICVDSSLYMYICTCFIIRFHVIPRMARSMWEI